MCKNWALAPITRLKWPRTIQKFQYKNCKNFSGWWTTHGSYLNGGRSLASDTILAFKSRINWKYGNASKYLFVYFHPMLENSYIGSACAKSLRNRRMKVHQDYSKTYEELIIGMLNSPLYAGGDAEESNYKISRNLDKQINIVTMFVSRIILKLVN